MDRIIFFSGGLASFATAHYVKENFREDNILLLFTDTQWEDYDLYRFIYEVSDKLELPMLILKQGFNPLELMKKDNFLYNSRIARCSIALKVNPARRFIKKGKLTKIHEWYNKEYLKSENFDNPILYYGIGFDEAHRTHAIEKNWQPYKSEFPLVDNHIDTNKLLKQYDIEKPRLYKLGFTHNNCGGRCIKGGQGHWIQLLEKDYSAFQEMRDFEQMMNGVINAKKGTNEIYAFLKKTENGITRPYQLKELEKDYREKPKQLDIFDFGTCGCFVDE